MNDMVNECMELFSDRLSEQFGMFAARDYFITDKLINRDLGELAQERNEEFIADFRREDEL